jgi:hypothetical protein
VFLRKFLCSSNQLVLGGHLSALSMDEREKKTFQMQTNKSKCFSSYSDYGHELNQEEDICFLQGDP